MTYQALKLKELRQIRKYLTNKRTKGTLSAAIYFTLIESINDQISETLKEIKLIGA